MYKISDIMEMLGIGRTTVYSFTKEAYEKQMPFKVVKLCRIPKCPFGEWAENGDSLF